MLSAFVRDVAAGLAWSLLGFACASAASHAAVRDGPSANSADSVAGRDGSPPPTAEAAAESPKFDILEFRIEGNTLLPAIDIERAVYPYLGPGKTIDDVEQARGALEKAFQTRGYQLTFVDIPQQEVVSGIVVLNVTEGKVGRLRVSGARYYQGGRIKERVPSLAEGTSPYFPAVQKELRRLSGSADRSVVPVLRPGTVPGQLDVDLKVKDQLPLHGSIELNNRASQFTDELRFSGSLRYDNLWHRDHSAGVSYLMTPTDPGEIRVLSGNYLWRLADSDRLLAFYAVRARSRIGGVAQAGPFTLLGDANIAGVRFIVPVRGVGEVTHYLTTGADYKHFGENQRTASAITDTPISYVPFTLQYSLTQQGQRGVTRFSAASNFAMRGVLGTDDAEFAAKRFGARANYAYFRIDAQREQYLPKGFRLVGRFTVQRASQPLITNEKLFAGGVDTVRGYLEFERAADDGVIGGLELRSPSLAPAGNQSLREVVAYGFFEGARLRQQEPLPLETAKFDLSSAGLGLRLKAYDGLNADVSVGVPFVSADQTRKHDPRVHFRLAYDF